MINFISTISFTSRKQEIRQADDISRKTSAVFPMVSASKYEVFGDSFEAAHNRYSKPVCALESNIKAQRREIYSEQAFMKNTGYNKAVSEYLPALRTIKKSRIGNCWEMSAAAVGILYANGFLNSKVAGLVDEVSIINKKTGECVQKYDEEIDHSVVITSMKRENEFNEEKCNIVVDSWANFADDKKNAVIKYKQIFANAIKRAERSSLNDLKRYYDYKNFTEKGGKKFNTDDYIIRSKLYFKPYDKYSDKDAAILGGNIFLEFKDFSI